MFYPGSFFARGNEPGFKVYHHGNKHTNLKAICNEDLEVSGITYTCKHSTGLFSTWRQWWVKEEVLSAKSSN